MTAWWVQLELDVNQQDLRSIKRAYARLLKQHRSDQDPEGFRRIHDANQLGLLAVESLVRRPEQPDLKSPLLSPSITNVLLTRAEPLIDDSVRSDEVIEEDGKSKSFAYSSHFENENKNSVSEIEIKPQSLIEEEWERAVSVMMDAVGQPSCAMRTAAILAASSQLAAIVRNNQVYANHMSQLFKRYLPGDQSQWRVVLTDDDLFAEISSGNLSLTTTTLGGCFGVRDWARLQVFSARWLALEMKDLSSPEMVSFTRTLIIWLAPYDYKLAQRLTDALPISFRRKDDQEIDSRLALGQELASFPLSCRKYLCELLLGDKHFGQASAVLQRESFIWLRKLPRDSQLRLLVGRRFPEKFGSLEDRYDGMIMTVILIICVCVAVPIWIKLQLPLPPLGIIAVAMFFAWIRNRGDKA